MNLLSKITPRNVLKVTSMSLALSVLLSSYNLSPVSHATSASIQSSATNAQQLLDAPKLIADSTRNTVRRNVDIEFTDDLAWRNAITAVKLNGYDLSKTSLITVSPGRITFDSALFQGEGTNSILIEATGYSNADITQLIVSNYEVNLALNKPTFTSENAKQNGKNAVDGDPLTRWESEFADSQYMTVDLGAVYDVCRVVLNWENAAGKNYDIELSLDGTNWTTVYTTNQGESNNTDVVYFTPDKARYVKMNGHTRTTDYGFSLWEMEVNGLPGDVSPIAPAPTLHADATDNTLGQPIDITFTDNVEWRNAISEVKVNGAVIPPSQYTMTSGKMVINSSCFTESQPYWISVQAKGFNESLVYQTILPKNDTGVPTNPPTNPPSNPPTYPPATPGSNVGLGKPTLSSPNYHRSSEDAVDGRFDRRWESDFNDNQWMSVDLGTPTMINRVLLNWENAYGKAYTIDVSADGNNWNTVYATDHANGGIDDISFSPVNARYVKMNGIKRGTPYGFSLWEFEVYAGTADLIEGAVLTASTTATIGKPVTYTFADDTAWRYAINSVELNGAAVSPSNYRLEAGKITLDASLFIDPKAYQLTIGATGYTNSSVVQTITLGSSYNLALNKPTTTSNEPLKSSNYAVDGDKSTRWESPFSDPQWISVDLGESSTINRIVLDWENAAAKSYRVEVSIDGKTWTTVYATTSGHEGTNNLIINQTEARYVKVTGTERTTQYGYSLFELGVY
ncbi:discoidin domain-containing protein [Paenibacillus qinlingensis]|uniref:F5/8 type C domain-containing protein n=1 Tax=Paenibacillus qinlingensis TaxID=1837343 RepID=A0ABU1NTP0_9BACL|nr:discoidin domain-containing protein [Paenibacillus qinlingensis]MDR6550805.1 hypothetical protein [Paenibacillus qinlingensis]